MDVYAKEFGAYSREYYEDAIKKGRIRVNGKCVDCAYVLKNGDTITHSVHRHILCQLCVVCLHPNMSLLSPTTLSR